MTDQYTPAVGDRVQWDSWSQDQWAEVLGIHADEMWIRDNDGSYYSEPVDDRRWIKVERPIPIPHRYIGLYEDRRDCIGTQVWRAPETLRCANAVLHIWTDEDGVDRIERVKP